MKISKEVREDMLLYAHLILKELNASWNEQINEYFDNQERIGGYE
jgi:hypothetical protein